MGSEEHIETAVRQAKGIQGWMNEAELRWLAEQASKRLSIVEFGAWKGRSTKALCVAQHRGGVVHTFDWFQGQIPNEPTDFMQARDFAVNLREEMSLGYLRVHYEPIYIAPLTLQSPVEMVFIDAGHSYECMMIDIPIAKHLLRHGGLLCGHDFSADAPGVQQAVRELVPDFQRAHGGDIWFKEIA